METRTSHGPRRVQGDSWRQPLRVGDTCTQVDLTLSSDFDTHEDERTNTIRSEATVLAAETAQVPAGTFAKWVRVRTQITQSAVGSSTGQLESLTTVADGWYAAATPTAGATTRKCRHAAAVLAHRHARQQQLRAVHHTTAPAPGATTGGLTLLNASGVAEGTGLNHGTGPRLRSKLPAPLPAANGLRVTLSNAINLQFNTAVDLEGAFWSAKTGRAVRLVRARFTVTAPADKSLRMPAIRAPRGAAPPARRQTSRLAPVRESS